MTDVDAVRAANTALYDAFETGDIDLMGALWLDEDAAQEVSCVHPGWSPLHGRGAVLRSWSMIMANTTYIQFVLTEVAVQVVGDVAVVTCGENMLTGLSSEPGEEHAHAMAGGRAVATNIFRRTSGGWRLWVHHASPVLATQGESG